MRDALEANGELMSSASLVEAQRSSASEMFDCVGNVSLHWRCGFLECPGKGFPMPYLHISILHSSMLLARFVLELVPTSALAVHTGAGREANVSILVLYCQPAVPHPDRVLNRAQKKEAKRERDMLV